MVATQLSDATGVGPSGPGVRIARDVTTMVTTQLSRTSPTILRRDSWIPDDLAARLRAYSPKSNLGQIVKTCFSYLPVELAAELLERIMASVVLESSLALVHVHGRHSDRPGQRDDYGIVGRKVVTTAGVNYIVDAFQNSVELENMKYHGLGTGGTAEASGDTALVTELTTQYLVNSTRPTGTTVEGASANIFRSVGGIEVDASVAATEHGLFSASSAGTLLDRTLFSVINLASGDSISATYELTNTAGG